MKNKSLTIALIVAGICALGVISASAQSPFTVNYFANNGTSGAPDATVRVTNPGTSIGGEPEIEETNGNVCAMMYVFDNDQQMSECCGCLTTPDGLRTFSVTKDLTSNPLTGVVSKNGDIKIFASYVNDSPCNPAGILATGEENNLRAWATHIQNKVGSAYPITETAFSDAQISGGELNNLEADCYFIQRLGSGHGICSCGTGD
jgi:hypothetical protein